VADIVGSKRRRRRRWRWRRRRRRERESRIRTEEDLEKRRGMKCQGKKEEARRYCALGFGRAF
jgi:hypothetical protein